MSRNSPFDRLSSWFGVLLGCLGWLAAAAAPAQDTWDFEAPDDAFTDAALLDLRALNERRSGETGFVRRSPEGDSFVRGDGRPIRFWALGSDLYRRSAEEMDRHCRFLAKMGVNMVRLHAVVANTREGAAITDVNEREIEGIFRFVRAAKDNGIYITISPYYGHHPTPRSWQLEGYGPSQQPWGALFIDPHMQEGYRAWTRALYTRVNPHTGLALRDDPTVAILQIHNEDSLFFWTMQRLPEPQAIRLAQHFGAWAAKKYGTLDQALAAWSGQQEQGDDVAAQRLALMSTWHMTQIWSGGQAARLRDQVQFLAEFQRDFYARMGRYLREELGCHQLLNATNWRTADDLKLKDIERWTYAALDIDAENEYYGSDYQHVGENNGYRIDPGHFLVNESCLHKPLELTTNFKTQVGRPFIVTETSWKHPNLYQSEGPFLIAAYQSLGGVDIVYWFSATDVTWLHDPRRMFWKVGDSYALDKWSCSTPMLLGMFPANAVIFRQGYLRQGDVVVREVRSLESLWERKPPLVDDNEIYGVSRETAECQAVRRADGRVSRAAFLVGPVQTEYGGDPSTQRVADFSTQLDAVHASVHSQTGQLDWDYRAGICRMHAPQAQGVAGFLRAGGGRFALDDVTIESDNEYAAVSLVSLDALPLQSSHRVLVQVGTTTRLTGWQDEPAEFPFDKQTIQGRRIVNTGRPPWQIAATRVKLTVSNPHLSRATRLDPAGYAAEDVAVKRGASAVEIQLPADTMYLVLQDKDTTTPKP